ncbi:MAG: hypothetical protein WBC91_16280, partial [Phototrophicaceae bacterium]
PLGGRAFVMRDIDFTLQEIYEILSDTFSEGNEGILNSFSLVELNRDLTSIPFETASTQIQEYEFAEDDENTIRIVFLPAFNDEVPFLFPFGGIRSFRACGNVKVKSIEGNTITRHSIRQGAIMTTYNEMRDAFDDALDIHEIRKSQRYLLAQDGNIENGISISAGSLEGGTSTPPKITTLSSGRSTTNSLPPGIADEAILYGAAYAVAQGFIDLVNAIILRKTTQSNTVDFVVRALRRLFILTPVIDGIDAANDLITTDYEAAAASGTLAIGVDTLARFIYCGSGWTGGISQYIQSLEDAQVTNAENIARFYEKLVANISNEQIEQWVDNGLNQPREGYQLAPCYRLPELVWDGVGNDFSTIPLVNWNFTSPRLVILSFSGNLVYEGTGTVDPIWKKDANGNISRSLTDTQAALQFNYVGGSNRFKVTDLAVNVPNYSPSGVYNWTITIPAQNYTNINNKLFIGTTGTVSYRVTDLGPA